NPPRRPVVRGRSAGGRGDRRGPALRRHQGMCRAGIVREHAGLMVEYLKQAPRYSAQATEQVRRTVSEMLLRIQREGEDAIRQYSRELDGWDPPSFQVDRRDIEAAANALDPELREHIAF